MDQASRRERRAGDAMEPHEAAQRVPSPSVALRDGPLGPRAALASAILLVAAALYGRTAAPTITWQNGGADSAELVTASYTLGIAHPPGYPLYLLLGKVWSLLPLGEVAYRYSLFSAACGALTVALVAVIVHDLERRGGRPPAAALLAGAAAGGTLAVAPAFWAQATVPEVYTLHTLLLSTALFLLFAWRAALARRAAHRHLALCGLAISLGLANHLTTVFLLPLGLAYIGLSGARAVPRRAWLAAGLWLLGGLALYGYLPLRAAAEPAANWGAPATLERFLRHVTGADYGGYLLAGAGFEPWARVPVVARLLAEQYTWPGVAVLCIGAVEAWATHRRETLLLLGLAAAAITFAICYNVADGVVYLLPAYVVGAILLGLGVGALGHLASGQAACRAQAALALGTLTVLGYQLAASYAAVDASTSFAARDYALARLAVAAPGEPLYTTTDEETFPLWYAQQVLGVRPDVPVVDVRLARYDWYRTALARQYPALAERVP